MNDLLEKIANGQLPVHCNRCDMDVDPVLSESGPHIKAACPHCKTFVKFLKRVDAGQSFQDTILGLAQRLPRRERHLVARKILAIEL